MTPTQSRIDELLADLRERRDTLKQLESQFPAALKRWAEVEKAMAEHHIKLTDVLVGIHGTEEERMSAADISRILRLTKDVPMHKQAWDTLSRLSQEWDDAMRGLIRAQQRWLLWTAEQEERALDPSVLSMLRPFTAEPIGTLQG